MFGLRVRLGGVLRVWVNSFGVEGIELWIRVWFGGFGSVLWSGEVWCGWWRMVSAAREFVVCRIVVACLIGREPVGKT